MIEHNIASIVLVWAIAAGTPIIVISTVKVINWVRHK